MRLLLDTLIHLLVLGLLQHLQLQLLKQLGVLLLEVEGALLSAVLVELLEILLTVGRRALVLLLVPRVLELEVHMSEVIFGLQIEFVLDLTL